MAAPRRPQRLAGWPWWSLLLTAAALINPIGLEFIANAMSGDPWSQAIAGPILFTVLVGLALLVLVESVVRMALNRHRVVKAASEATSE
jgi:hypothetical protein